MVVPSLKVTEPEGVPAPGDTAVTVAVKVTDCPNADGFTEEVTTLKLSALLTVWPPDSEPLLLVKLLPVLGVYVAETVWLPTARTESVPLLATPLLPLGESDTGEPKLTPSTAN